MRQMIDELVEKPQDTKIDDRLEQRGLSRKEKRKYKKEKLQETMEGMSPSEKRKYLLYYYKEVIIIALAIIASAAVIGRTIYRNSRPITISYVVVNCVNQLEFNLDAVEDYAKAIGKYDGCQVKGDTNVKILKDEYTQSYEDNANSQIYINFTTMATSDYYDVVFTNYEGAVYCGGMDIFYPLDKYLDKETYNKIKDRIVKIDNMAGQPAELAIDISDTEFAKSLNVGYDDIYIGFPGDQERNHVAVKDLLDYLFP